MSADNEALQMSFPEEYDRVLAAVRYWFEQKESQLAAVTQTGRSQGGTRDAVVGGKHLDGLNTLVVDQLDRLGVPGLSYLTNMRATLPGYYRASKSWDLLVMRDDEPILAVEYKSMKGSEGKNLNNRIDEVLGVGEDLRAAQEHGLVPAGLKRAYVFIMESTPEVLKPVGFRGSVGELDPAFLNGNYLQRMAILCSRIREAGLYDMAWAIAAVRDPIGFYEPDQNVGWLRFRDDLASAFA